MVFRHNFKPEGHIIERGFTVGLDRKTLRGHKRFGILVWSPPENRFPQAADSASFTRERTPVGLSRASDMCSEKHTVSSPYGLIKCKVQTMKFKKIKFYRL